MISEMIEQLKTTYPEARCSLNFNRPLQALVAVLLSAQCRDERVNQVTAVLFERFDTAEDLAQVTQEEMEEHLKSLGLYRNKAQNLRRLGAVLTEQHSGQVPDNLQDLLALPGVGRKTALCVLQEAFGQVQGIVVDTHVARLAVRLGWSRGKNVEQIEQDLQKIISREHWAQINHLLIAHGRAVCTAARPRCPECVLQDACPAAVEWRMTK